MVLSDNVPDYPHNPDKARAHTPHTVPIAGYVDWKMDVHTPNTDRHLFWDDRLPGCDVFAANFRLLAAALAVASITGGDAQFYSNRLAAEAAFFGASHASRFSSNAAADGVSIPPPPPRPYRCYPPPHPYRCHFPEHLKKIINENWNKNIKIKNSI